MVQTNNIERAPQATIGFGPRTSESHALSDTRRTNRKWTKEEDDRLLRQIRAFPQNLHWCFVMVAEELGRSDKAIAAHWYQKLSKQPDALAFATLSAKHLSKNRKNGMGVETPPSLWRRFLTLIKNL